MFCARSESCTAHLPHWTGVSASRGSARALASVVLIIVVSVELPVRVDQLERTLSTAVNFHDKINLQNKQVVKQF